VSVRRARPLSQATADAARVLSRAEAAIALLDRVRPTNFASELSRLFRAAEGRARVAPAFEYAKAPELGDLRRELERLGQGLSGGDLEQRLLAERATELELEARMVERVGSAELRSLGEERFPLPRDHAACESLALRFLTTPDPVGVASQPELHESGDLRDPDSLWSHVSRRLDAERWPTRVEMVVGLVSLAAVAEGAVRIRAGAMLTAATARRIALHEVEGHVRPRMAGRILGGLFAAGARRASEDEEGRAIWLEEQAGLLDGARRAELARRYWAACSVRAGAEFWDTVDLLGQRGATLRGAVELAARAQRGGGLGREVIYLAGYARVAPALSARPALEFVLRSGRVGLDAAEGLLDEGLVELDDDRDVI
jgi:hypothetical protein